MKLYVGLDLGLEETNLCIVDSEGHTVREVKISTEPTAIRSALEGFADRLDRSVSKHRRSAFGCIVNYRRSGFRL
jgi:predicted NBD/HSP70 family sugar kinase